MTISSKEEIQCNRCVCFTGRFPGEGGIVAPGMSCQYTVRFAPDSLADYEDALVVETQSPYPLIIPVEAHRPPPILSCESTSTYSTSNFRFNIPETGCSDSHPKHDCMIKIYYCIFSHMHHLVSIYCKVYTQNSPL